VHFEVPLCSITSQRYMAVAYAVYSSNPVVSAPKRSIRKSISLPTSSMCDQLSSQFDGNIGPAPGRSKMAGMSGKSTIRYALSALSAPYALFRFFLRSLQSVSATVLVSRQLVQFGTPRDFLCSHYSAITVYLFVPLETTLSVPFRNSQQALYDITACQIESLEFQY